VKKNGHKKEEEEEEDIVEEEREQEEEEEEYYSEEENESPNINKEDIIELTSDKEAEVKRALQSVPEQYKEFFLKGLKMADMLRDLLNKQDWVIYSKSKEAKLKVRTSESGLFCLKSTALIPAPMD